MSISYAEARETRGGSAQFYCFKNNQLVLYFTPTKFSCILMKPCFLSLILAIPLAPPEIDIFHIHTQSKVLFFF